MKNSTFKKIRSLTEISYLTVTCVLVLYTMLSFLEIFSLGLLSDVLSLIQGKARTSYLQNFQGTMSGNKDHQIIVSASVLFLIIVVKFLTTIYLNYLLIQISIKNEIKLKISLTKSYLEMEFLNFINEDKGRYIYHFQHLTKTFSEFVLLPLIRIIGDATVVASISIYLFFKDPYLTSITLVTFSVFFVFYDLILKKKLNLFGKNSNDYSQQMVSNFENTLLGQDQIKLYENQKYFVDKINAAGSIYKKFYSLLTISANLPRYRVEVLLGAV